MVIPQPLRVNTPEKDGGKPFRISDRTSIVLNSSRRGKDERNVMRCVRTLVNYVKKLTKGSVNLQMKSISEIENFEGHIFLEFQRSSSTSRATTAADAECKTSSRTHVSPPTSRGGIDQDVPFPANESYALEVSLEKIVISAQDPRGVFNGIQTLRQLFEIDDTQPNRPRISVKPVEIEDEPRFPWRGIMLDVSRHFFDKDEVKKIIETMAIFKLNRFHWHLVDDQGWRLEINSYPKLTEVGGRRTGTPKPGSNNGPQEFVPYFGHYTQAEIREVVEFAEDLFITVMPEIEIPGHSQEVVAAYEEIGNTDIPGWSQPEPLTSWGVSKFTMSPKPETFKFIENVLQETVDLFPSADFVHIGGDEAPTDQWALSPLAQQFMRDHGFTNPRQIQGYFTQLSGAFLEGRNKRLIGWNEILEGEGLPESAAVMVWNNINAVGDAVRQGHEVVNAIVGNTYFDYSQSNDPTKEPESFNGVVTLSTVHSFDPVPNDQGLTEEQKKLILGTQGQLWTEYIPQHYNLEYMIFPRALALAEVAWSTNKPPFEDFLERLPSAFEILRARGVNYRPLENDNKLSK